MIGPLTIFSILEAADGVAVLLVGGVPVAVPIVRAEAAIPSSGASPALRLRGRPKVGDPTEEEEAADKDVVVARRQSGKTTRIRTIPSRTITTTRL